MAASTNASAAAGVAAVSQASAASTLAPGLARKVKKVRLLLLPLLLFIQARLPCINIGNRASLTARVPSFLSSPAVWLDIGDKNRVARSDQLATNLVQLLHGELSCITARPSFHDREAQPVHQ